MLYLPGIIATLFLPFLVEGKNTISQHLEYIGHLCVVAEHWTLLSGICKTLDKRGMNDESVFLVKQAPINLRSQILSGEFKNYYKNPSRIFRLPGTIYEYPSPAGQLTRLLDIGKVYLKGKDWNSLLNLVVDKIIPDPEYETCLLGKRFVVIAGLALIDNDESMPDCISPWNLKDPRMHTMHKIENKAKTISDILKIRRDASGFNSIMPDQICSILNIGNEFLCVRVLVLGGYKRVTELFGKIKNEDNKGSAYTEIVGCWELMNRGTKKAKKFLSKQRHLGGGHRNPLVLLKNGKDLDDWSRGVKEWKKNCPTRSSELEISHRLNFDDSVRTALKVRIDNYERLFWSLMAARQKDAAIDILELIEKAIKRSRIPKKTKSKISVSLNKMHNLWDSIDNCDYSDLAGWETEINQVINDLKHGDMRGAEKSFEDVLTKLRASNTTDANGNDNLREHPISTFLDLIIKAHRNPQIFLHTSLLENSETENKAIDFWGADWTSNWYFVQAVDAIANHDPSIYFAKGEYRDWIEKAMFYAGLYKGIEGRLQEKAKFCNLTRTTLCKTRFLDSHLKSTAQRMCQVLRESDENRIRLPSIFPVGYKASFTKSASNLLSPMPAEEGINIMTLDPSDLPKTLSQRKLFFVLGDAETGVTLRKNDIKDEDLSEMSRVSQDNENLPPIADVPLNSNKIKPSIQSEQQKKYQKILQILEKLQKTFDELTRGIDIDEDQSDLDETTQFSLNKSVVKMLKNIAKVMKLCSKPIPNPLNAIIESSNHKFDLGNRDLLEILDSLKELKSYLVKNTASIFK